MPRFTRIDASHLDDHHFIDEDDRIIFLREYVRRQGYYAGKTNQLISNLKKDMDRRGNTEWKYKARAILQCAREIGAGLNPKWLRVRTIVPVPPSKAKNDPEYDDRMLKVCQAISTDVELDVRELVIQTESMDADHKKIDGVRHSIQELTDVYEIDERLTDPEPVEILSSMMY